jgi:hypothetical protein
MSRSRFRHSSCFDHAMSRDSELQEKCLVVHVQRFGYRFYLLMNPGCASKGEWLNFKYLKWGLG